MSGMMHLKLRIKCTYMTVSIMSGMALLRLRIKRRCPSQVVLLKLRIKHIHHEWYGTPEAKNQAYIMVVSIMSGMKLRIKHT